MNINRLTFAGYIARDPELRYTPKGTAVTQITVCSNRQWTDEATGEKKSEPTFIDFTAWGKTAEVIAQYFKKGKRIYIEGRLKVDSWEDKTTQQKRSKVVAIVESFQFIDHKEGEEAAANTSTRPARAGFGATPPASAPTGTAEPRLEDDDDVPF